MKTKFIIIETTIFVLLLGAGIANGQSSQNTPLNQVSGPAPTASTPQSLNSLNITAPGAGSISNGVTPGSRTTLYENLQYTNNGGSVNPPAQVSTASYTLLEPLPCYDSLKVGAPGINCDTNNLATSTDIKSYVQYMFNLLIAISAVAAIFMIVLGGFIYMTSDSLNGKSDGKEKIQHAVEGLLMVLCSYLILRTINPQFVNIPNTLVATLTTKPKAGILSNILAGTDSQIGITQATLNNSALLYQQKTQADIDAASSSLPDLYTQHNSVAEQLMANQDINGNPLTASQRSSLMLLSAQVQDQINKNNAIILVGNDVVALQQTLTNTQDSNPGITINKQIETQSADLKNSGLGTQMVTNLSGEQITAMQHLSNNAIAVSVRAQLSQNTSKGQPLSANSFNTKQGIDDQIADIQKDPVLQKQLRDLATQAQAKK